MLGPEPQVALSQVWRQVQRLLGVGDVDVEGEVLPGQEPACYWEDPGIAWR